MGRMGFLVSTLLAFALAATVLSAALLVGLFPTGPGGVAVATPGPSGSIVPGTPGPSAAPTPTLAPTPSPGPTQIPPGGGTYTVQPGDYLSLIGERLGVPWQLIADANGIVGPEYKILVGQVLIIPATPEATEGADFYVVKPGDNITAIALKFDVSPTDLADFNRIADWNSIQVGDILYIPGPGWTPLPEASF